MMSDNDFTEKINLVINQAIGSNVSKAKITSLLSAIATAQGTDTRTHDVTIEAPPAALKTDIVN